MVLDRETLAILRAVVRLSGPRRQWVRTDRVLRAVDGVSSPYHLLLERADWRETAELAAYRRLCSLVAHAPELVEGNGNFSTTDTAPAAPVFNRCRAGSAAAGVVDRTTGNPS